MCMLDEFKKSIDEAVLESWNELPDDDKDFETPTKRQVENMPSLMICDVPPKDADELRDVMRLFGVKWNHSQSDNAKIRRLFTCWNTYGIRSILVDKLVIVESRRPVSGKNVVGPHCYAATHATEGMKWQGRYEVSLQWVPFRYFLNPKAPDGIELVDSRDKRFWADWTEVDGFLELIANKPLIWYTSEDDIPSYDADLRKVLGKKLGI